MGLLWSRVGKCSKVLLPTVREGKASVKGSLEQCECVSVSVCVTPASKKMQGSLSSVGLHLNLTDSAQGKNNHFSLAHSSQAITLSFDGAYFCFTCQMHI